MKIHEGVCYRRRGERDVFLRTGTGGLRVKSVLLDSTEVKLSMTLKSRRGFMFQIIILLVKLYEMRTVQ